MTEQKIRWGVLSTANIGRVAVNPAIQASNNGTLFAVASRNAQHAREFAERSGIPRHYGSYDALLDDPDVDAIYIPLPNSLHRDWSMRAAERGKHVLCEKPLALNAAECREMQVAASTNGTLLMEAFMYRFHPRTEQLVAMSRAGALGSIRAIRSAFTFRLSRPDNIRLLPELGGGALMDVGCYCVNVSRTIAGAEPEMVQAWATWGTTGVDLELTGTLRFASGLLAHFDCAMSMDRREVVEVAGTDASLTMETAFTPGVDRVELIERRAGATTRHDVPGTNEYVSMVEHFADSVLHRRPVRYDAREAEANMAVIEALYRSARSDGHPAAVERGGDDA
ncbi:MAG: Gfo/Idh/MocA family oxidoreductase [Gemmatimonadaceae bacterium]